MPSQADTAVYEALAGAPMSDTPHALRWYNHIKSFAAGMKQFPKASKASHEFTSCGGAAAAESEEDDDVDLLGSEDEEESKEKKRITEERLKDYHVKMPDSQEKKKQPDCSVSPNILAKLACRERGCGLRQVKRGVWLLYGLHWSVWSSVLVIAMLCTI